MASEQTLDTGPAWLQLFTTPKTARSRQQTGSGSIYCDARHRDVGWDAARAALVLGLAPFLAVPVRGIAVDDGLLANAHLQCDDVPAPDDLQAQEGYLKPHLCIGCGRAASEHKGGWASH